MVRLFLSVTQNKKSHLKEKNTNFLSCLIALIYVIISVVSIIFYADT
jgi:hypothetical protein